MTFGGRKLTGEELRLWREVMGEPGSVPEEITEGDEKHRDRQSVQGLAVTARAPRLPQAPGGLGKHEVRAIRRGKMIIENRIDLHGMTRDQARAAVTRFLKDSAARGLKCVLVITGKGGHVTDQAGRRFVAGISVLRVELPHWLGSPELAQLVTGSEPALPKDGGSGARYVLLRRPRS